ERSLSSLASRENRWQAYERFAAQAGVELPPPELWLLGRIQEREPVAEHELAREFRTDGGLVVLTLENLRARSLVEDDDGTIRLSDSGSRVRKQMHLARCDEIGRASCRERRAR